MADSDRSDDKPASLLTKTQRSRIREAFAEQDEHQRRRDQRQIRERVRAGVTDFEVLADYPDRQFELAFDDLDEEALTAALADARLVTERLRSLHGVDRQAVVDRASDRANAVSQTLDDTESLDGVELVPAATYRQQGRAAAAAEHGNRWDERADGLLKTAAVAALPLLVGWFADTVTEQNLLRPERRSGS
ncbi:ABC transporter permease [Halomicroarcula sp. GCM10025709]|uniref:ABC transporter permease n=1 Tax=Halomicroarcula sp. GCM10025709 TaxID=3252669 RepID=UPI00361E647E